MRFNRVEQYLLKLLLLDELFSTFNAYTNEFYTNIFNLILIKFISCTCNKNIGPILKCEETGRHF